MRGMARELREQHGVKVIRRIRGDGNCYYRAVYFGYFELLIRKGKEYVGHLKKL